MFVGAFAAAGVQQKEMPMMMKDCPLALPDTNLAASDTPTGIAINITTKPDNVLELRRRVEQMAARHNAMSSHGGHEGMMMNQMLPGTAAYEPIENGARLTLTPKDPGKLVEFRTQVRAHVEQMGKGGCTMMQSMMKSMNNADQGHHPTEEKK